MKKNAVLLYGLFSAFMLIFLTGCSDKIENISDMNGNEVLPRLFVETAFADDFCF